ncbi:MAG: hypothetical protein OEZ20_05375, partial [candidate division WOR-3 bacterium]|nr:hypothetical protein [candidate division WOR-3 bacterium]
PWFSSYKAFTRECCRTLSNRPFVEKTRLGKKYYGKAFTPPQESKEKLEQSLNKIISKWQKEGLKQDVLLKLKEKIVSVFFALRLKGII